MTESEQPQEQPTADEADARRLRHVETASGAVAWLVVIAIWEWVTADPKLWPGHWQGGWIGVGMLAWALYWLAYRGWPTSWVVVSGAVAALAFAPQAPGNIDVIWLALGFAPFAWLVAEFQHAVAECKRIQKAQAAQALAIARDEPQLATDTGADNSRLGLIHLMAWVTLVAVCLGVSSTRDGRTESLGSQAWSAVYVTALSAPLFGLLLFIVRRLRQRPFPTQPGDFLWLALGVEANSAFLQLAGLWQVVLISGLEAERSIGFSMMFVTPTLSGLIALVARGCMPTRRWRLLMGILAVTNCWVTLGYSYFFSGNGGFDFAELMPLLLGMSGICTLAPALQLVACLIIDWRQRVRHNWTHRIGVVLRLLSYTLALISVIGSLVAMDYFG